MTDVQNSTIKNSMDSQESIKVELLGRDLIELIKKNQKFVIRIIGCHQLHSLVLQYTQNYKINNHGILHWPLPTGNSHSEILLRELILKAKKEWNFPYEHVELCHCRAVLTSTVDQAIISGAHTPEKVSRLTSASTACGTCKPDVEQILKFRLR